MLKLKHFSTYFYVLFCIVLLLSGCKEVNYNSGSILSRDYNKQLPNSPTAEISTISLDRSIWQKPDLVVRKIGDVSEKVLADIGVGTGFFLFKLVPKVKQWIAIDIDPKYIKYIDSIKNTLPPEIANKILVRMASPDNPNLKKNEVDIILIINTIAYLPNLPEYLENLKQFMKEDAEIIIIDYKMKKLPINAPPKNERIYLDHLEDLLIDAGYQIIESDDTSLDFQYIVKAKKNSKKSY